VETRHTTYACSQVITVTAISFLLFLLHHIPPPYPDELMLCRGFQVGNSPQIDHVNQMQDRSHTHARARHMQTGTGHVGTNFMRKQGHGPRGQGQDRRTQTALLTSVGLCCRTNSMGRHAQTGARHAVEAPGQWYLACRYRCRLSASTEPVTREM